MPELTECMYAHQQICIPPTFPYILRQYAKAAIRSQPTDLLKWSTAYFRCLSLSLPPPVKPRLEYPIQRTHYGLTPGWLKTLLKQLAGYQSVTWPLLVDRWQGACLDVDGLIEIIMTAGFNDPADIPWYKFVATAAGFLMSNLTNTMILICELLTEEPEGASASITCGTFTELYEFLAALDAGEERNVRNFYFTKSNLDLTKRELIPLSETMASEAGEEEAKDEEVAEEHSLKENVSKEIASYRYDEAGRGTPTLKEESSEESMVSTEPSSKPKSEEVEDIVYDVHEPSLKEAPSHTGETLTESSAASEIDRTAWVQLGAVPGIGPPVPTEMVAAVVKYVRETSLQQQGMFMPRNIRHFTCPPLEPMTTSIS